MRSPVFAIGEDVYALALRRGYEFFYYQRCGVAVHELVPGYVGHAACHLDDHVTYEGQYRNLTGGWHSAGDYAKHTYWGMHIIGTTYACLLAYELNPSLFDAIDHYNVAGDLVPNGVPDVLDEAMFGLEYLERIFLENGTLLGSLVGDLQFVPPEHDTDNVVGTEDDRWLFWEENHVLSAPYEAMWAAACFAKMGTIAKQAGFFAPRQTEITRHAENLFRNYSRYYNFSDPAAPKNNPSVAALCATWDLYKCTGNADYATNATTLARAMHAGFPTGAYRDELGDLNRAVGFYCYWARQNGTAEALAMARDVALGKWHNAFKPLSSSAGNVYGLLQMPMDDVAHLGYIWDRIGLNSYYLTAAFAAFLAYNVTVTTGSPQPGFLAFGLRQLDWVFGCNPLGVCMVEGVGTYNPPIYHHRYAYIPGNPRGAVPGAVVNGYIEKGGKPFLNVNSAAGTSIQDHLADAMANEPWLPHNVHLLFALAALSAI